MSRPLKIALYALFTLSALALSFFLTFPWDAVGRRLEFEAVKALPGSAIAIGEVGPALPVGIALGDITLQLPSNSGAPGAKVSIQKIRLKPLIFSSLTGKPSASFELRAFSGELNGQVKKLPEGQALALEIAAQTLQLDDDGLLARLVGYDIKGGLSGRADLTLDEKGVVSDGKVDLIVAGAEFVGGKISGFTVPALNLGTPELSITFEKGQGTINKLATKSPDIEASLSDGKLTMRKQIPLSLIQGTFRAKPSDDWLEKAKIKALVGMVPASIRKPDGTFEIALNGTLNQPAKLPGLR